MSKVSPVILLFGPNGQVGWELRRTLSTLGEVVTAGIDAADEQLDVTDGQAMKTLVDRLQPGLMVNATAYTAVDKAESEPEVAHQVNCVAVGLMGELAAEIDCPVVHYSTDYVFSGNNDTPWKETDETGPRSVYGRTKLAGEQALAAAGAEHLTLRTAWVYGTRGNNFLLTMLRLFDQKTQLNIVADQFGAPTWSRHIAEATAQMLARLKSSDGSYCFTGLDGVYHLTSAGQSSWHEFAQAICEQAGSSCQLAPISSDQYPCAAERPVYSVLDNSALAQAFSVSIPHWMQGLKLCMDEMFVEKK